MTRGRGRPRSPDRQALDQAVLLRCDARSRATARQLNAILDTHILADAAALVWRDCAARARKAILTIPGKFLARRPTLVDAEHVRAVLDEEIRHTLEDLADEVLAAPDPAGLPADEPRAVVRRSRNVTRAREQLARLSARLIDLKARVRPYCEGPAARRPEEPEA